MMPVRSMMKAMTCTVALALGFAAFISEALAATTQIQVPVSRSELLVLPEGIEQVVIADPNIADVFVHGATRVSVVGKALGSTSLRIFDENGNLVTDAVVKVTYDLPEIRQAVKNFFPNERVGIETVNDNVAITGMISDAQTAKSVVDVVEEYLNEERLSPDEPAKVINLAKIRSGQQVLLRVRIGELERRTLKNLGVNLAAARSVGNYVFQFATGSGAQSFFGDDQAFGGSPFRLPSGDSFLTAGGGIRSGNNALGAVLDALEQDGLFKVLAEPNLTAMSGENAEFLVGGEFPIPVSQGNGGVSVQFREYGIGVQFTPLVLSPDRIRLVVQPEVSEIDTSLTVDTGTGSENGVPALTTRRVKTTIELAPGEGFMLAGLISDQVSTSVNEVPGVAEIPLVSSLFRSTSFRRSERELVVAVTPYLVDPVAGTEIRLPADDYRTPSLMEQVFYGSIGHSTKETMRISQTPSVEGPIGFMVD